MRIKTKKLGLVRFMIWNRADLSRQIMKVGTGPMVVRTISSGCEKNVARSPASDEKTVLNKENMNLENLHIISAETLPDSR